MSPQALVALTTALLAVAGCTEEETRSANSIIDNLTGIVPVAVINDPVVAPTAIEEPVSVAVITAPVVEECVSIFRLQTCEDGILHKLDPNTMEWLD